MKQSIEPQPSEASPFAGIKECPLCTKAYDIKAICIVLEDDATQLIHVTCEECNQALLAYIVESKVGMSSIGMLTDLTLFDVMRMQDMNAIEQDDILNWHELLVHQKTFIQLLRKHTV